VPLLGTLIVVVNVGCCAALEMIAAAANPPPASDMAAPAAMMVLAFTVSAHSHVVELFGGFFGLEAGDAEPFVAFLFGFHLGLLPGCPGPEHGGAHP